eukprot:TRINITY_DN4032_c1_g2_i1.p1 TRINITY_DN4032_c1_g2~~TRINITY_DN4032_c1_g2_i1.p1  ORF type:complete len:1002 (+),score=275.78 TRINITY_DN4032_c1_g2_i1:117-3008(+)
MVSAESMQLMAQCLERAASPDPVQRQTATDQIKQMMKTPGFSPSMLSLVSRDDLPQHIRQMGAVVFKNYIKENWIPDGTDIIGADRDAVKSSLIQLMLVAPDAIQRQAAEALKIISAHEFPKQWPGLTKELADRLVTQDFNIINRVLSILDNVLKKYGTSYKCESVLRELAHILNDLQQPLLTLVNTVCSVIDQSLANPAAMEALFTSILHISDIFYSLNGVDIPEFFEDHIKEWMAVFHKFLSFQTAHDCLLSTDDDVPGLLHRVQSSIFENVDLYLQKYEEEFQPFLGQFVQDTWTLLVQAGPQPKFDPVVTGGIKFLCSAAKGVHHGLFAKEEDLKNVCENIVITHIKVRESDEEQFEFEPVEYIRRDIEGSDTDTRRQAACELVKSLRKHFEQQVTGIFSVYINAMLKEYASNPTENWRAKDAAIYLITALAVTSSTAADGATRTNELVPVMDFFQSNVLSVLQQPQGNHAVIQADCLKFTAVFRNQMPKQALASLFPLFSALIKSESYVVSTYAAHCVERFLTVRQEGSTSPYALEGEALAPFLSDLLTNLFDAMGRHTEEGFQNEYLMKALDRLVNSANQTIAPVFEAVISRLSSVLAVVCKNPSNPHYNHHLFETIAAIIKNLCSSGNAAVISRVETAVFPSFQHIMENDVEEFSPYVFDILALLMELTPVGSNVSLAYAAILPNLLKPPLWEQRGNISPLVRLLQAYLERIPQEIVSSGKLLPMLGVFHKLISSKRSDHEGFYLLEAMVMNLDGDTLSAHMAQVFQLICMRLQNSKTTKFMRSFTVFVLLFVAKHGGKVVSSHINGVQQGLLEMMVSSVVIPSMPQVAGLFERKICAIGSIKLLTEAPASIGDQAWVNLLVALLHLLEEVKTTGTEAAVGADSGTGITFDEAHEYATTFSRLSNAKKDAKDPFAGVNAKTALAQALKAPPAESQAQITARLAHLPEECKQLLSKY